MARYESPEPVEIMDRLLWRDAQQMLDRHAQPGVDGRCEWCGWHWPCPPRRLAERAEIAARSPGSLALMSALEEAPTRAAPAHSRRHSGPFD